MTITDLFVVLFFNARRFNVAVSFSGLRGSLNISLRALFALPSEAGSHCPDDPGFIIVLSPHYNATDMYAPPSGINLVYNDLLRGLGRFSLQSKCRARYQRLNPRPQRLRGASSQAQLGGRPKFPEKPTDNVRFHGIDVDDFFTTGFAALKGG
jgi:hypothetical protein